MSSSLEFEFPLFRFIVRFREVLEALAFEASDFLVGFFLRDDTRVTLLLEEDAIASASLSIRLAFRASANALARAFASSRDEKRLPFDSPPSEATLLEEEERFVDGILLEVRK